MVRIPGLKVKIDDPAYETGQSIVFRHPRSPTEEGGDTYYGTSIVKVLGYCELMISEVTFDKIYANIWCTNATRNIRVSIYERDSVAVFTPSAVTPKHEETISAGNFPSDNSLNLIELNASVTISAGKYVFIIFSNDAQITSELKNRYWSVQSESPTRSNFLYSTSYTEQLSFGGTDRYSASFQLARVAVVPISLESLLLEYPARFAAYDNEESGLEATTVQGAIDELAADVNDLPRILLPDEIAAVVGDTLQLFKRGIIESQDPYKEPNELICSIGSDYPRYYELTPVSGDAGTKELTVNVLDMGGNVKVTDSVDLVIVNPTGSPGANKNILCLGDSLLNGGVWPTELQRRLCGSGGTPAGLEYTNISLIGDQGTDPAKYMGYGGWTFATYLGIFNSGSMITCTHDKDASDQHSVWVDSAAHNWILESIVDGGLKMMPSGHTSAMPAANDSLTWVSGGVHQTTIAYTGVEVEPSTPLWDSEENEFSIKAWVDYAGYSGIDVIYVLLGWNNMIAGAYDASGYASVIENVRTFLDKFHAEYPSGLVRILGLQVPSPNGGLGTNYGATGAYSNYFKLLKQANGLNLAYQSVCNEAEYSDFCRFIAIAPQFDSEYNMARTTKVVNTRSSTTEIFGTNGVHPAATGYYQIADAVFRDFIRTFCSS